MKDPPMFCIPWGLSAITTGYESKRLKLDIILNLEIMLYWGNCKVYGSQFIKTELKEFLKMSGSYSKMSLIENMPLFYEPLRKKKMPITNYS